MILWFHESQSRSLQISASSNSFQSNYNGPNPVTVDYSVALDFITEVWHIEKTLQMEKKKKIKEKRKIKRKKNLSVYLCIFHTNILISIPHGHNHTALQFFCDLFPGFHRITIVFDAQSLDYSEAHKIFPYPVSKRCGNIRLSNVLELRLGHLNCWWHRSLQISDSFNHHNIDINNLLSP